MPPKQLLDTIMVEFMNNEWGNNIYELRIRAGYLRRGLKNLLALRYIMERFVNNKMENNFNPINVKFTRKKRKASENSSIIIQRFVKALQTEVPLCNIKEKIIDNENKLDEIIKLIEQEVASIAITIESYWAIPIVMEAVAKIYYGDFKDYKDHGTTFKRALSYLWNNIFCFHGENKNIDQLLQLLYRCSSLEFLYNIKKMFWAIPNFYFKFENGYGIVPEIFFKSFLEFGQLNTGRGQRFRISKCNSKLMNDPKYNDGLIDVLCGKKPSEISIFKGTFFEKIPGIENEQCKKFWQAIFTRYFLYLVTLSSVEKEPSEIVLFHEFGVYMPENIITQDIVENVFWKQTWFEKQSFERYGNLIVDRPIMRISEDGDFVTSPILIADSINFFIEKHILGYTKHTTDIKLPPKVFKEAISEPFEQKCIEYFRSLGFITGHVSEKEIWKTQCGSINMKSSQSYLYGEIDVLAFHKDLKMLLLIECKVLNEAEDTDSYKNLIAKLKEDSEGFSKKLIKKGQWLKETFFEHYGIHLDPVLILLTDIPLPILNYDNEEIIYTSYAELKEVIKDIFDQISYGNIRI